MIFVIIYIVMSIIYYAGYMANFSAIQKQIEIEYGAITVNPKALKIIIVLSSIIWPIEPAMQLYYYVKRKLT